MDIFVGFSFFSIFLHNINCIILETKQGTLKGEILSSRNGRPYNAFYSIPYAEPPVGKLRFQSPVLARSWQGVRDATVLPPSCMCPVDLLSDIAFGQEDCLYLNVYTPRIGNYTLLPVMVYFHGGIFIFGDARPSRLGPQYFMDEDVVVITFHYRLGALGFLSTEDEVIPGNYGLKDAIAVLQWVQKYVDAFGGDKNCVTLFGGSTGAISASLTLISPLAKGLIHRVISQSGFFRDLDMTENPRRNAWKFASSVRCNNKTISTSEALLECLRKLPAEQFIKQTSIFYLGYLLPNFPWRPVIENEKLPGAFLVDQPIKLLERKSDIPWMVGINSADGGIMAIFTYFNSKSSVMEEFFQNYKKYMPILFRYGRFAKNSEQADRLTEIYKKYYFGNTSIRENVHAFSKMFFCLVYLSGIKEVATSYRGRTYVYYYDHRNKETFAFMYGKYDGDMGVVHGDELISLFNWSESIKPVTEGVDLVVSKQMVKFFVNFAATGDPNGTGKRLWRPVDSPDINYLHIKDGKFNSKEALLKSEYEFLESVSIQDYL